MAEIDCVKVFNKARKYINDRRRAELKNCSFEPEEIDRIAPRPRKIKANDVLSSKELETLVNQAEEEAADIGSRKKRNVWNAVEVLTSFSVNKDGKLCVE